MSFFKSFFGTVLTLLGAFIGAIFILVVLIVGIVHLYAYLESDEYIARRENRAAAAADSGRAGVGGIFDRIKGIFGGGDEDGPGGSDDPDAAVSGDSSGQDTDADTGPDPDTAGEDANAAGDGSGDDGDDGDDGGLPDIDAGQMQFTLGGEFGAANIEGDSDLRELNIEADELYKSVTDSVNAHLDGAGEITDPEISILGDVLDIYEATVRRANMSGLQSDPQAVYARIMALQLRRLLGLPV